MREVILLVGTSSALDVKIKAFLEEQSYKSILCNNPDEIDQAGKQRGRQIIIFTDLKYAKMFLTENKWADFELRKIFIHPPTVEAPANQLRELDLVPHSTSKMKALLDDIKNFLNKNTEGALSVANEDLLFCVNSKNEDFE